jgi:L-ribulokinase
VTSQPQNSTDKYVIGIDFGTLSGRAVVVRCRDGQTMGSAVHEYEHAVMDTELTCGPNQGLKLPPDWALQVPQDYLSVLANAVPEAVLDAQVDPADIVGIGTDFTACTLLSVKADGTPLCDLPEFAGNPNAYVKLWKNHSATNQAERVTKLGNQMGLLQRYGGSISSEWAFPKALFILEDAPEVYQATDYFVEAADWIIWQICGEFYRNKTTLGYKEMFQDNQFPPAEFASQLNPQFADINQKLAGPVGNLGDQAGELSETMAKIMRLPAGIAVAVGNVDAHVTAPAANAIEPGQMTAIMGTSTCHVMNGSALANVPGVCGVVDGGILEGLWGYELGQSGVGDIFAWLVETTGADHTQLSELASRQKVGEHGLLALDWHSGNRTILNDQKLSGLILGMTLTTTPADQYRAYIEATAFGTRKIIETLNSHNVPVQEFVAAGGLLKNQFLMQTYADILNMPLSIMTSYIGPALGSAIHAAVAAGQYNSVREATSHMGQKVERAYLPNPDHARAYDPLYQEYSQLHDYFGQENLVMHRLKDLKL